MKQKILDNIKVSESGCWEWQRSLFRTGYGRVRFEGKSCSVHRVAYKVFKGEIPADLCVMHSCDNRKCCNPAHLSLGTASDNMKDMVAKGRNHKVDNRGESNGKATLTVELVTAIYLDKRSHKEIAKEFNVAQSTVSRLKGGKRWHHVTSTLVNT